MRLHDCGQSDNQGEWVGTCCVLLLCTHTDENKHFSGNKVKRSHSRSYKQRRILALVSVSQHKKRASAAVKASGLA